MKEEISFEFRQSAEVFKEITMAYFLDQGFKLDSENNSTLTFSRGSLLSNMFTFNPLKWKSEINISLNYEEVVAQFLINAQFQAVTEKEQQVWQTFMRNYQESMITGKVMISENNLKVKEAKNTSWGYVGYALLGAVVIGVPSGIIAAYTGIDSILNVGATGGAIAFTLGKISKDNQSK